MSAARIVNPDEIEATRELRHGERFEAPLARFVGDDVGVDYGQGE